MIERLVENWLTNASERSVQLPFCYILEQKGHKVIHLTRHHPIEFGKDVISVDQNNVFHAFQLKQGNISQKIFREILTQIHELCFFRLVHPKVPDNSEFIPYLVTTGNIDENVTRMIGDLNISLRSAGKNELQVIVFGDLRQDFINLGANLWPSELPDYKRILEFALNNGESTFPKEKFINLIESMFELNIEDVGEVKNLQKIKRVITSAAILASYCSINYQHKNNHIAVIECWGIFLSQVYALVTKHDIAPRNIKEDISISYQIILNNLHNLVDELSDRDDLFEGDIIFDRPFYGYRATEILGFTSLFHLWHLHDKTATSDMTAKIQDIFNKYDKLSLVAGEFHIPYRFAAYLSYRKMDSTYKPIFYLKNIIDEIILSSRNADGLPNPYYSFEQVIPYFLQNELRHTIGKNISLNLKTIDDSFKYNSFYLDGLSKAFARNNFKNEMRFLWPNISRFTFKYFHCHKPWHFLRFRNENLGYEKSYLPEMTKSWANLKEEAKIYETNNIPPLLLSNPVFSLLFLILFPHRVTPDFLLFLDTELRLNLEKNGL